MTVLNITKQNLALLLAGSSTTIPTYFMIGSGSGTTVATMSTLINPISRQAVTSTDPTSQYKVTWQGDWSSVQISGVSLTEFGITISGTGITGSQWTRTGIPVQVFNGTQELQIQETAQVF